jgi:hypothetical protein
VDPAGPGRIGTRDRRPLVYRPRDVSAVLILAGVLSPLGLPAIDLANFVGYILWSAWLVAFAVLLLRRPRTGNPTTTEPALSGDRS